MLIQTAVTPTLLDDIDPLPLFYDEDGEVISNRDGDGIPEGATYAGWTILDSVGILDASTDPIYGDHVYGAVNFKPASSTGTTPTGADVISISSTVYVGRYGTRTGEHAEDWVASTDATLE
jgi:hypothetical protein